MLESAENDRVAGDEPHREEGEGRDKPEHENGPAEPGGRPQQGAPQCGRPGAVGRPGPRYRFSHAS